MFAVIYQIPARSGVGMIHVAGRPLIERQLQWLRASGCQKVALEVGTDPASGALARWLAENEALAADVSLVLAPRPLGPKEVARRAGFREGAPFIALPADVLGDGDLTFLFRVANGGGALALAEPPAVLKGAEGGIVRLIGPRAERPHATVGAGWSARVGSVRAAMTLGSAALRGRLPGTDHEHIWPIQIHASEVRPGIWIARGAEVDPGAEIEAPALIGPNAVVRAGARVGPDAFIEQGAVIEAGASVTDSIVEAHTIVGEGVLLDGCVASPKRITEIDNGMTAPLEDSLLIGGRAKHPGASLGARFLALVALAFLLPVAAVMYLARAALGLRSFQALSTARKDGELLLHEGLTGIWHIDVVPRLLDVVSGTRVLFGVTPPPTSTPGVSPGLLVDALEAPCGAIDVEPALVPEGGDLETRLRGRAWYAQAKSLRVDMELLRRLVSLPLTGRASL